ncbi:MAG TPA: hypothetical protein VL588_00555 [Bdellovibrionota bacterium]|nr:hypothetical protein [Bdellovibrionota bacterium]
MAKPDRGTAQTVWMLLVTLGFALMVLLQRPQAGPTAALAPMPRATAPTTGEQFVEDDDPQSGIRRSLSSVKVEPLR